MISGNGKLKRIIDVVISPSLFLAAVYMAGFIVLNHKFNSTVYNTALSLDMEKIFRGEVWRLVTFNVYPPGLSWTWFVVSVWMVLSAGRKLEKRLGKVFVLSFVFFVWLGDILVSLFIYVAFHQVFWLNMSFCGFCFLLLAALLLPRETFRLFTCIEVNAMWLMILFLIVLLLRLIYKITVSEYLSVLTCLAAAGSMAVIKRRHRVL